MNALEKYASSRARKKKRLRDALKAAMKRERSKGWLFKETTRPLHPKTQLLESQLEHLTKGHKAGKYVRRKSILKGVTGPKSVLEAYLSPVRSLMTGLLPGTFTEKGVSDKAQAAMKSGKESKRAATLIRKLLSKGKA